MKTRAVYIDGGYLDKLLERDYSGARVDMEKLVHLITQGDELLRAYYYHCLPYRSDPPTPEEQNRFADKRRFLDAISYIPRFEIRLGQLQISGMKKDGRPNFEQKRVDMMMGVDMALLAVKHRVDRIWLLTGDSDAIPAVEAVKPEGITVTLVHGPRKGFSSPSRELYKIVDERVEIDADMMNRIRRRPV